MTTKDTKNTKNLCHEQLARAKYVPPAGWDCGESCLASKFNLKNPARQAGSTKQA